MARRPWTAELGQRHVQVGTEHEGHTATVVAIDGVPPDEAVAMRCECGAIWTVAGGRMLPGDPPTVASGGPDPGPSPYAPPPPVISGEDVTTEVSP